MSLNITDSIKRLGTKLGVDMSKAPASNIADSIDYISDGVGAHTGVIADAIDKLEIKGGGEVSDKPVRFYAVDELAYSYTKDEFLALSAMPANPAKEGLTPQGWNWSFESAKNYVQKYGELDVGQVYITDDGKTRFYIETLDPGVDIMNPSEDPSEDPSKVVRLSFKLYPEANVTIDWGDGTNEVVDYSIDDAVQKIHLYNSHGQYVISLTVNNGGIAFADPSGIIYPFNMLKKVNIGEKVFQFIFGSDFRSCLNLKSVTIPNNIDFSSTNNMFQGCNALKHVTFPSGLSVVGRYAFNCCYSLRSVSLPEGVYAIDVSAFRSCYNLQRITLPQSLNNITAFAFSACISLTHVVLPSEVERCIQGFVDCNNLITVDIGENVTYLGDEFSGCDTLLAVHLHGATPPVLSGNSFSGDSIQYIKFFVPYSEDHSILNAYKEADNWSKYTNNILEEPQ